MSVVVIGGGVVGLASAYRLASAGLDVTVLESGSPGAGASHGNAAKVALAESAPVPAPGVLLQGLRWMLRPDSPLSVRPSISPSYLRFMATMARHCNARDFRVGLQTHLALAETANELFDAYVDDQVDYEMHSRGVLLAFETEKRYREHSAHLETYEQFGMVPTRLVGDEVQQMEPALSDRIGYGLHFEQDRQIEPASLTRGLLARLEALDAQVRPDTQVRGFQRDGDRVTAVETADGQRIAADHVVLAAGAWTGLLSRKLGAPLPINPGKGYSIDYRPAPVELRTSLTLEDARVAITPLNGMIRLAGTMEFGSMDSTVNPVRVEAIRRAAREGLRGWAEADTEGAEQPPWAGLRPMTPDGLPVIGRLEKIPNAYIASGHGMLGLTLAPGTAEIVVDQLLGRPSTVPDAVLAAVSPQRFTSRRVQRTALQAA